MRSDNILHKVTLLMSAVINTLSHVRTVDAFQMIRSRSNSGARNLFSVFRNTPTITCTAVTLLALVPAVVPALWHVGTYETRLYFRQGHVTRSSTEACNQFTMSYGHIWHSLCYCQKQVRTNEQYLT